MATQPETVFESTFKKWTFATNFNYDVTDDGKVDNVSCITCSAKWHDITREAERRKIRGASLQSLKQYVDGIHYIHRSNLERHCASPYHKLAERLFNEEVGLSSPSSSVAENQPRIDFVVLEKSRDIFAKYFRTALWVAMEELPLTKFGNALELQRNNGVNIPAGKDSRQTGKEMIRILAETIREDIKEILLGCNYMSGLNDGSEARKTREEKELVYVKIVYCGVAIILFLKCQRMIDFGGTDSSALLKAVREAFASFEIDIADEGRDVHKLVSMCADGASTNMGCKNGALTVLKMSVPWLIIVHCSLHKLELARRLQVG